MTTDKKFNAISILDLYHKLFEYFGPRSWWPADTSFEVIIGAILTQNTAWKNVETALKILKAKNLLSPEQLAAVSAPELAQLIRSSGYFNQKAKKIKAFVEFFQSKYQCKLELMTQEKLEDLRFELLTIYGIGNETADSILLYALEFPSFVVDAYTIRIFSRMSYVSDTISYMELKKICESSIPIEAALYNEFHALLVKLGHDICLPKPKCNACPVRHSCQYFYSHKQ